MKRKSAGIGWLREEDEKKECLCALPILIICVSTFLWREYADCAEAELDMIIHDSSGL